MSETKNVIKSIGVLSILSDENNEMLKKADIIKEVGLLIARESFYSKYPNITLKNIGNTFLVPDSAKVSFNMGVTLIDQKYLDTLTSPTHLISMGAIMLADNTDTAQLSEKISGIHLMGAIVCPENMTGAVSSLVKNQMGVTVTYPSDTRATVKAENGHLILNNDYVSSLKENTVLIVNGNLNASENINSDLAEKNILHIIVNGYYTLSADNRTLLGGKSTVNGRTIVIPKGYDLIKSGLTFDECNIAKYKGKNIFVPGTVTFDPSVTQTKLEENSFSLMCEKAVLPADLKNSVSDILLGSDAKIISYNGKLVKNKESRKITMKELSFSESPLHLLNYGTVELDENISDELFNEKVSGIHNYGMIKCSDELYGLVQLKMTENEGSVSNTDPEPPKDSEEIVLLSGLGQANL